MCHLISTILSMGGYFLLFCIHRTRASWPVSLAHLALLAAAILAMIVVLIP